MSTETPNISHEQDTEEEEQGHPFWFILFFFGIMMAGSRIINLEKPNYILVFIQQIMIIRFAIVPCFEIINGLADDKLLGIITHVDIYKSKRLGIYALTLSLDNSTTVQGWFKNTEFEQGEILSYTRINGKLQVINKWFYLYQLITILIGLLLIAISAMLAEPIWNWCQQHGCNGVLQESN